MIRQDYLLRLIEQLGEFLRAVVDRSANRSTTDRAQVASPQTDDALEEASQRGLGLSYTLVRSMSPDELLELFRSGGKTWIMRCFFVARLLEFDAQIAETLRDSQRAADSAGKALYLYDQLRREPEVPVEYEVAERVAAVSRLFQPR